MTDAQIMVKITDEVLAFALDQPRHATSMQVFQMNTKDIKSKRLFFIILAPASAPALPQVGATDLLWPRDTLLLHTHLHLLFVLTSKTSERINQICEQHLDLMPEPSPNFFLLL